MWRILDDMFEELRRMQERMNKLFEEFELVKKERREIAIDVIDEGDSFRLVADLPGFSKEEIDVYFEGDSIAIKAERKEEKEEKTKDYFRRERRFGTLYRKIELPEGIDKEKAKASYKNGVLEIILPKLVVERKKIQLE